MRPSRLIAVLALGMVIAIGSVPVLTAIAEAQTTAPTAPAKPAKAKKAVEKKKAKKAEKRAAKKPKEKAAAE
ncbi:MAG: hypothetical protein FJX51_10160 [Alphaproteobacteria bacterium]|nr:hypothetical protein [Alphaproteobacteria bacterium]